METSPPFKINICISAYISMYLYLTHKSILYMFYINIHVILMFNVMFNCETLKTFPSVTDNKTRMLISPLLFHFALKNLVSMI